MTALKELRTDKERLWRALMEHAQIGRTDEGGIDREALTATDRLGREVFAKWAREEGATVDVDELGNMFATVPGSDPSLLPIAFGSHLDTQPNGGRFDGVLGVLAGLEVLRTLKTHGVKTRHPLCIVNWTAEEGSRFPVSMAASGVWAGVFPLSDVDNWTDSEGISFREALRTIGYRGEEAVGRRRFKAYFELHIEQGPVLEAAGKKIGIVTGGQAMSFNTVTIKGRESHAGTTPMEVRLDPVSAFVRIASACETAARKSASGRFTVGVLNAKPGSHSVIPRQVEFTLDMRHPSQASLDELLEVYEHAAAKEEERGFSINRVSDGGSPAIVFDLSCVEAVRAAVTTTGYSAMEMISGAGHDALFVARVCPTAMIFTPCLGGISHNPAESITPEEATAGADVLLQSILTLDHI